jgi:hypothetical protein
VATISFLASAFYVCALPIAYPLHVSSDNRSMLDQNNQSFLIVGDAGWSVIVSPNSTGAAQYFDDRKTRGFNTIMINLIEHEFTPSGTPRDAYGNVPFNAPINFSKPNESYFQHADWVINYANSSGFLLILFPAYLGYNGSNEGWYKEIVNNSPTDMYNYGVYLGNRYKKYDNIIWALGGDYGPHSAINHIRELVRGLNDGAGKTWLFTVHNAGGESGITDYNITDRSWITLSTTYNYCPSQVSDSAADYARNYPFFMIEGEYEGSSWGCHGPPAIIRGQAYWSILYNSLGHVYGQTDLWYFNSSWQTLLNTQGSNDMTRMNKLFLSRDWYNLIPDVNHAVLTAGYGTINTNNYVTSSMTRSKNTFIAYAYSATSLTINLSAFNGTSVNVYWYNPSNGSATLNGTYAASGSRSFTLPTSSDWVMVIDNAALNLTIPGTNVTQNNTPYVSSNYTMPNPSSVFPLHFSADKKYLLDKNNLPFIMNGEAGWSLIVGPNKAGAVQYINDRHAKKFNTLMINLIEHYFDTNGAPKNANGDGPFMSAGNFSTPNEPYFQYADWLIKNASDSGFLVILFPAYLGDLGLDQGWYQDILANGNKTMYNYGYYLGYRYRYYDNIIWAMGGDYTPNAALDEIQQLVHGLNDGANKTWLYTVHNARGQSGIVYYPGENWINLSTTYSNCNLTPLMSEQDYNRTVPYFYIEGIYEAEGASATCVRSQAYWSILSGSNGHMFGNGPIWQFSSTWASNLNTQGANDMTRMIQLFQSRNFSGQTPDLLHKIVTAGYGSITSESYVASALINNNNSFIVYTPSGRTLTINLSKINAALVNVYWYNPSNGSATLNGTYATSASQLFTTPSSSDWVLVIDNAALNLTIPGSTVYPNVSASSTSIVQITASGMGVDSLLGIPRRKMVIDETNPNKIWIFTAGGSNAYYSSNTGITWTPLNFFSVIDHDSFDRDINGNIHTAQRMNDGTVYYRRINSPATQLSDYVSANDESFVHYAAGLQTASAILANGNEIWAFSRVSLGTDDYYDGSTDGGLTWTRTGLLASGLDYNRIGAMVIDTVSYAIIWQRGTPTELITFYYYNGTSFVRDTRMDLRLESRNDLTRVFSFAQTDDGNVHVSYWDNIGVVRIRDTYKKRSDAAWSTPLTVGSCYVDCLVSITAHGNDIYASYLGGSTGTLNYNMFSNGSWQGEIILDGNASNRYPAFPKKVPANATFVPLAWTRGSSLYYYAIPAAAQNTTTSCTLPYDSAPCNCINATELNNAINGWYADAITIPQLMQVIKAWKSCNT